MRHKIKIKYKDPKTLLNIIQKDINSVPDYFNYDIPINYNDGLINKIERMVLTIEVLDIVQSSQYNTRGIKNESRNFK